MPPASAISRPIAASQEVNSQSNGVIPGWSAGPDPESRDSGFDASHRPGMTAYGLCRFARNDVELQTHVHDLATRCARAVDKSSALRGRGERRVPVAPAASCALVAVERTRVTTSTPESPDV